MTSTSTSDVRDTQVETKNIRETPAQNALSQKIAMEYKKLSIMRQQLDCGMGNVSKTDISKVESEIHLIEKKLTRKVSLVAASQKLRLKRKSEMNKMLEENPNFAKTLKLRNTPGRPRLEADQLTYWKQSRLSPFSGEQQMTSVALKPLGHVALWMIYTMN